MAAYIVAQLDVKNTHWHKEYGPQAGALMQKHGGKMLAGAGGALERLEGDRALPSVLFLLEFLSLEQAKAWDNDPAYVPLMHVRQTGADAPMLVVEGGVSRLVPEGAPSCRCS